jgi:adenylate kinase
VNLVFFGPPGVGKGTQARLMVKRVGIPQISTGDMLRGAIATGTPLGAEAQRYMSRGELVPDAVMIGIVAERLQQPDTAPGFILDGFPRTIPQAEALDAILTGMGRKLDWVVHFEAGEATLVRRLAGRQVCKAAGHIYNLLSSPPKTPGVCDIDGSQLYHREDDNPETVRRRLQVYGEQTEPLLAFYQTQDRVVAVNAEGDAEETHRAMMAVITSQVRR